jgi:hypothetical protein
MMIIMKLVTEFVIVKKIIAVQGYVLVKNIMQFALLVAIKEVYV